MLPSCAVDRVDGVSLGSWVRGLMRVEALAVLKDYIPLKSAQILAHFGAKMGPFCPPPRTAVQC